ncbi:MAG TPA: Ig-like domain-containing protein [Acidimicrobiales bacterium]|nr:Ig-like domain-containing protein [Acidimicrobiales bacterium]
MRATRTGMRVGLLSAAIVVGLVPLGGGMADAANQSASGQGQAPLASSPADQTTKTFSGAGTYTLDLPADVHGIIVNAAGGFGGTGDSNSQHQGGGGAPGTVVSAVVPVPNGVTKLTVVVGGNGHNGTGDQAGGYNGGGNGGHGGGGGGGATEVRAPDGSRLVVAAGGGGGGSYGSYDGGGGGSYDHSAGGDGNSGAVECHGRGGGGATTTSGGSGGKGPCIAPNGDGGAWLAGGEGGGNVFTKGGGGGGGGYYGGGGGGAGSFGSGAGGGAGSSYVEPAGTHVSMVTSYGSSGVTIIYPAPEVPDVTCPSPMPGGTVGRTFAVGCRVSGAPTPGVTLSQGSLPPGLSLVAPTPLSTGDNFFIRGVPTAAGTYPFNLTFSSAPGYDRTVSLTIVVSKAPVRVELGASPPKGGQGQTFVFTATVTPQADVAIAERPSGLVTFLDGDKTIGVDLVNEHGGKSQALLRVTDLSQGDHRIQAVYAGASNFAGGSDALTYPVDKTPTSITLFSSANPVDYGASLSYVATVSSGGVGVPTGTLFVVADGSAVEHFGGTLVDGHLQGNFPQPLGLGHHSVVATYQGADTFQPSQRVLDQVVNGTGVATTTSMTASTNAPQYFEPVTFTATVSSSGGSGSATGEVRFVSPQGQLDQSVPVVNGTASLTWSYLDVGFHDVTATYAPSGGTFITSTGKLAGGLSVNRAATTTSVTSSDNPSLPGQAVTFYAHVASQWGAAQEGRANLTIDGHLYDWCSGTLGGGVAAFPPDCYQPSALGPGPHTVSATYLPFTRYLASSGSAQHVVRTDPLPTVTSVRSSDRTSQFRQAVTFTASVTSMGKAIPTGDVQFAVDDVALGGPAPLSNGVATSQSIADLALGTHKVTATYSGSTPLLLAPSDGSLADGQLVAGAPSTTTVSSSVNPYVKDQVYPPTFTVHVTSNGAYATGEVNMSIGSADYHGELRYGYAMFDVPRSVVNALPLGDNYVNVQYLSDSPAFRNSSAQFPLLVK